jgi:DNA-binding CsgD family transcriptional regulator
MRDDPTRNLSRRQRECLRLMGELKSSKEIARELNIKPRTVDSYLATAVTILEATDRRHAARIFAEWDQFPLPQKLPSQTFRVADSPTIPSPFALHTKDEREPVSFFAEPSTLIGESGFPPETPRLPLKGMERILDELIPTKRLLVIIMAVPIFAIAIAAMLNLVVSFERLADILTR